MWGRFELGHGTKACRPITAPVPPRASADCPLLYLIYTVNYRPPCSGCLYYGNGQLLPSPSESVE